MDATGDTLINVRNRALFAVSCDTPLRRSELVALHVADIVEDADGAATVLVRRSKTDAKERGVTLYFAPVRAWYERSAITERRFFRPLNRGALGERFDAKQVPLLAAVRKRVYLMAAGGRSCGLSSIGDLADSLNARKCDAFPPSPPRYR